MNGTMPWHEYWWTLLISGSPLMLYLWFWWKRNRKGPGGQYMDKWKAMQEDDRIAYYRTGKSMKRTITILRGMLTDEQKQQLEIAEQVLIDLSDDVEEEATIKIKGEKD
jgi:hypothetical protein